MINKYIKNRKFQWKVWLKSHWKLLFAGFVSIYIGLLLKWNASEQKDPEGYLKAILNTVIVICSIMLAILLSYVIPKIIQIRQEKLHFRAEYTTLTQQLHYFRAAIYPLYRTQDFWPQGLLLYLRTNYPKLDIYDVDKITWVDSTDMSPKASAFISDGHVGGMGNFYKKLEAFFPWRNLVDDVVYSEAETNIYYPHEVIELWHTFNLANSLYYYLDNEYPNYQGSISFNAISHADNTQSVRSAKKVKPDLVNTAFGNKMFSEIGSYVYSNVLPRLYELSYRMRPGLGSLMTTIIHHTVLIVFFGLIFPFLLLYVSMNNLLVCLTVSFVLYILLALVFSLYDLLFDEADIDLPLYRKDVF